MSFAQLTARLNQVADLAKALPADGDIADDKKIAAAAAEGEGDQAKKEQTESAVAAAAGEGEGKGEGAGAAPAAAAGEAANPEDDEDEDDAAPMAKSFSLVLEDGTQLEAFDGAALLKSFAERMDGVESGAKETEAQFIKAMNVAVDLISGQGQKLAEQGELITAQAKQLAEQGDLVKSLQERVEELANAGRGRKSTVTAHDKPNAEGTPMAKSLAEPLQGHEILAKAQGALAAGRISGAEASGIETRVNMGLAIEPAVLAKIQ